MSPAPAPAPLPRLILVADGGGSKVCVVVRADDGTEVRGTAGPCNVQSVGHVPAADRILEATYRALLQLPPSYLPSTLTIPFLSPQLPPAVPRSRVASPAPSGANTPRPGYPPLSESLFEYAWIALAGMTTPADATAFIPFVSRALNIPKDKISMNNDVNLLAAPALNQTGITHCVAVVCGTGTIAKTLGVNGPATDLPPSPPQSVAEEPHANGTTNGTANGDTEPKHSRLDKGLGLEDIGLSRGWGYMLDDEGSAFWIGRLAIRYLLSQWDRENSPGLYSTGVPPKLPLYYDLIDYFAVDDPTELIGIVSLMTDFVTGLSTGEASAKRNAYQAGAGRVVFKWAFPEEQGVELKTDLDRASHEAAMNIARKAVEPLVELITLALGDGTRVSPSTTALNLGGGLMNSKGYRSLLIERLKANGIVFRHVNLVDDAAGEGAKAIAAAAFA